MLTEEKIEGYISRLTTKHGKPAGKDLKRKTRKALQGMLAILMERGHDEPDESDYAEYRESSLCEEESTEQDIKRIKRYFEPQGGSEQLSMIPEEEMTAGIVPNVDEGATAEPTAETVPAMNEPDPHTVKASEQASRAKNKGGRKRMDENGEKKSEKFMMYFTPSLIADIRDWCSLKRVSCVDYITGLIREDLEKKKDKLEFFRKLSAES